MQKNSQFNAQKSAKYGFTIARDLIYDSGYVAGRTDEHAYWWKALRLKIKIRNDDNELRREVINRFVLRREMLEETTRVRAAGVTVVLLSDQTNWLDELNDRGILAQHKAPNDANRLIAR